MFKSEIREQNGIEFLKLLVAKFLVMPMWVTAQAP